MIKRQYMEYKKGNQIIDLKKEDCPTKKCNPIFKKKPKN